MEERIEEKVKKLIEIHKNIASKRISEIKSHQKPNWRIYSQTQYLNPINQCCQMSLDETDEKGALKHYQIIHNTLKKLSLGEEAYFSKEFTDAPVEIQNLLKNQ